MKRIRNAEVAGDAIRRGETWPSMAADLRRMVPRWHFEMLADTARNNALLGAIADAVEPGQLVLDVGTGAGLTALAVARAGAQVVSCESNPVVAELARKVVAANGYTSSVSVVTCSSKDLDIGPELPRPADVLVAEVFDADLFSEGALPTIADARQRLLRPGATLLPRSGTVWCQLVESQGLYGLNRTGVVDGFDLTEFNLAATDGVMFASLVSHDWVPLSRNVRLFDLDFSRSLEPAQRRIALDIDMPGMLHAAVVWFTLDLDGYRVLANDPGGRSHWKQAVFVVDVGKVRTGQRMTLECQHDTSRMTLSVKEDT